MTVLVALLVGWVVMSFPLAVLVGRFLRAQDEGHVALDDAAPAPRRLVATQ